MNYLRFFNLYFCDYVYMYIYVMILRFLFFIQTFLKYCKALSTEKYKRYISILLLLLLLLLLLMLKLFFYSVMRPSESASKKNWFDWPRIVRDVTVYCLCRQQNHVEENFCMIIQLFYSKFFYRFSWQLKMKTLSTLPPPPTMTHYLVLEQTKQMKLVMKKKSLWVLNFKADSDGCIVK